MGRKKQTDFDPDYWDPIAVEERVRARENYLGGLFYEVGDPHFRGETQWLVQGLIPQNYLCMLVAEPKEGKTSLATALALAVATGTPFAGRQTQQGAVLWLSAEESYMERDLLLRQSPVVDTTLPLYTCYEYLPIDDDDSISAIEHWISRTDARLVVVDPLQAAITSRSLSAGHNARRSLQPLKQMCGRRRVTVLVLHHRKFARYGLARHRAAENDQLTATASLIMSMNVRKLDSSLPSPCSQGEAPGVGVCEAVTTPHSPSTVHDSPLAIHHSPATIHQSRLIGLECSGRGEFANQTIWLVSHGPLDYSSIEEPPPAAPMPDDHLTRVEEQILMAIGTEPKTSHDILVALVYCSEGSARNCLTRLRRKGLIVVDEKEDRSRWYRLTAAGTKRYRELKREKEKASKPEEQKITR